MPANSKFGIDIVANDETKKGLDSAEKGFEKLASSEEKRAQYNRKKRNQYIEKLGKEHQASEKKRIADVAEAEAAAHKARQKRASDTSGRAAGLGFAAGERAFGGGILSSAVGARLSNVAGGVSTIRSAFAAATHESAGLAEKLGAVGVAAGGAAGAVAGLAFGVAKLTSSWVQGAAGLGRLSAGIGVSTDALQRWQGAGERFGVDKDTMGEALGGIGGTIHEAAYGRNNEALAGLNQLGIGIKRDSSGQVNVAGMAAALSDAIARQKDPYTQARIANMFGVPAAALPAFRQGFPTLRAQGNDFAAHGAVVSGQGVALGGRLYTKGVTLRQMGEQALNASQQAAAASGEGVVDGLIGAGRSGTATVAGAFTSGVQSFEHSVERFGGMLERWSGINLGSLGGKLNNLGNLRPVGGHGFVHYDTPGAGVMAMGRQIVRDQDVHGAETLYDLYAGAVGPDGKRHWGYAPASDHNDPAAYARLVGSRSGIGGGRFNSHDPDQLARIMSASIAHETGSKLSPAQLMPYAQRIVLEVHGLPAGTKVAARSDRGGVAIAHAMAGNGP